MLDDAVDKQINSSGPPFVGSFRSTEPLSRLHGESIKGRWTLVANSVTSDTGSLSWKISANTNDSAPKSSIERGKVFTSSPYTHDYKGFKSNIISISDEDTLKNLQVEISLKNETSNAVLKETGFQLVSPNDKSVTLMDLISEINLNQLMDLISLGRFSLTNRSLMLTKVKLLHWKV